MNISQRSGDMAVRLDRATKPNTPTRLAANRRNSQFSVGERVVRKSDHAAGTVIPDTGGSDDASVYVLFDPGVSQKVAPGDLAKNSIIESHSPGK